jgi:hypothetical protein
MGLPAKQKGTANYCNTSELTAEFPNSCHPVGTIRSDRMLLAESGQAVYPESLQSGAKMEYARALQRQRLHSLIKCTAIGALIFLITTASAAQAPAGQPDMPWSRDLNNYPGLLAEFGLLVEKLQHNVQYPPVRGQSRLLPLLPESTMFYVAFPNYGDATQQALTIFRQELREKAVLRDWWQRGEMAKSGPAVEDSLEKIYQFSEYLGDEIVVSGATEGRDPSLLIVAEVRKPGLKNILEQMLRQLPGKPKPVVRVLDVQELATAKDTRAAQQLLILVRPDLVVGALDLAALRSFNARLDHRGREFVSTAFGQRLARAYQGGATVLAAANLQKLLSQFPPPGNEQSQMIFRRTGFADMKYLVWEHKGVAGQAASQMELSFTGPRHGVAAWLAAPAPLGSLNFVSPNAILTSTVVLKDLAQIFEDVRDLSNSANPNAFVALAQMEKALNLSLKNDLLSRLGGEITLELDSVQPEPVWKAIFRVNDADRLEQRLRKLLVAAQVETQQFDEGGVSYRTLRIPSPRKTVEVGYAFVDGYLVIASSRDTVAKAIRLHETGESLAKSQKFLAQLPPGHSSEASALLYEDPMSLMALRLGQVSPKIALTETTPAVVCAYGEESAIREASTSGGVDAGAVLMMAAIAIPNLLRSKIAANEASAVGMIRSVDTAQIMYSTTYSQRGYARDLASLGPDPRGPGIESPDHANFIDLGNASCAAGKWCTKSGFRFSIAAVCKQQMCEEFVVVGTPEASNTGTRSFCSTSDGVVRFNIGPPLTSMVSASECQSWSPVR